MNGSWSGRWVRAACAAAIASAGLFAAGCGSYKHDYAVTGPDGRTYRHKAKVRWFPWVSAKTEGTVEEAPGAGE